jgi:polysaccharide pyruvyl transferase WcaK-like protein
MEKMSSITVRDYNSKERLDKYINKEITVTACPAFLLRSNTESIINNYMKKDNERIGINLIPYSLLGTRKENSEKIKRYKKITKEIREFIRNSNAEFYFIPYTIYDTLSLREILSNLGVILLLLQDPKSTLHTISKMDKMITTRYHSLIFSVLSNKPVFSIGYADKVINLAYLLKFEHFYNLQSKRNSSKINFNSANSYKSVKNSLINKSKINLDIIKKDLIDAGII